MVSNINQKVNYSAYKKNSIIVKIAIRLLIINHGLLKKMWFILM
jgi:hypothetical protein